MPVGVKYFKGFHLDRILVSLKVENLLSNIKLLETT